MKARSKFSMEFVARIMKSSCLFNIMSRARLIDTTIGCIFHIGDTSAEDSICLVKEQNTARYSTFIIEHFLIMKLKAKNVGAIINM